jgi:uncharacterized protein (TIGR03435 family)
MLRRRIYPVITRQVSRVLLFLFATLLALEGAFTLRGQGKQTGGDRFDVVSVKPSPAQPFAGRGGGACGGGLPQIEPTRFAVSRTTVFSLVALAYAKGCSNAEAHDLISGGPGWIKSDPFDIQAVIPSGSPTYTQRQFEDGEAPRLQLMIRNLLADRFKLAIHSEDKEMSVYALTVSKNGSKLQPFDANSCVPPPPPVPPGEKRPFCRGDVGIAPDTNRGGWKAQVVANGATLVRFSEFLSLALDRPVLDRTGISGVFDLRLESSVEGTRLAQLMIPAANQSPSASDPAPSIFTAIQDQLGLRLESTRGPVPVLVFDHAEKPDAN